METQAHTNHRLILSNSLTSYFVVCSGSHRETYTIRIAVLVLERLENAALVSAASLSRK